MVNPVIVAQLPNKTNIKYTVNSNPGTLEECFEPLVEKVRQDRTEMKRVIIYCRTYETCSKIYLYFRARLGPEMTEPIGAVDLSRFRLVDMFSACTTSDTILKSFCDTGWIVVATIAFGMGLDCPNVRRVLHWGPSGDIEQYVQETGRARRDGLPCEAVLYKASIPGVEVDMSMKDYCKNEDICRRKIILQYFDSTLADETENVSKCDCCDICAVNQNMNK